MERKKRKRRRPTHLQLVKVGVSHLTDPVFPRSGKPEESIVPNTSSFPLWAIAGYIILAATVIYYIHFEGYPVIRTYIGLAKGELCISPDNIEGNPGRGTIERCRAPSGDSNSKILEH